MLGDTMASIPIKTEGDDLRTARRLEAYRASFASNETHPHMGYYPGLPSSPWHDASRIPIVAALYQTTQVLNGRHQQKLFGGSGEASELQPCEAKVPLHMSEQHLDVFL
jgi:hypothetical protein